MLPALAVLFTYWIAPCEPARSACQSGDADFARWALEAWADASAGRITVKPAKDRDTARIRVIWAGAREGLYGEARPIDVNGEIGAEVYVRPDLNGLGPQMATLGAKDALFRDTVVFLTCLHETGHAIGLAHTNKFEDIMYAFGYGGDIGEYFLRFRRNINARPDIAKTNAISENDRRRLHALFPAP